MRASIGFAAGCILVATPAAAHAPIAGVGAFWNGVLHPFFVPLHMLAILAAGLLLGQNAPRLSRAGWPAFAVACALAVPLAGAGVPPASLLVIAATGGLLVAAGRPPASLLVIVAGACGALIGLDSAPDGAPPGGEWLARAGMVAGAVIGVTLAGGLAAALARPWQRIAVRAAGSWVAAASVIVLVLEISGAEGRS